MKKTAVALGLLFVFCVAAPQVQGDIVNPTEDIMTSGFFTGTNLVRGYSGDDRPVHRVSTDGAFGIAGAETIYVLFSEADFASFGSSVDSAILSLTSIDGEFGANADADNPFLVSAHAVNLDPMASITDDTNPDGTINWVDFFDNNILAANSESMTMVNGFGEIQFDVTSIINDWVSGSNSAFAIALTGKNDTSGADFLHGFSNNSDSPGATFLNVTPSAVPEPTSMVVLMSMAVVSGLRRRRK